MRSRNATSGEDPGKEFAPSGFGDADQLFNVPITITAHGDNVETPVSKHVEQIKENQTSKPNKVPLSTATSKTITDSGQVQFPPRQQHAPAAPKVFNCFFNTSFRHQFFRIGTLAPTN